MVAPPIEIAETCVRILTRRRCSTAPVSTSFILSRARVLSSFSCLAVGNEGEGRGGDGRGRRLIASNLTYSRRKNPDGAEFPNGILRNFACIAKRRTRISQTSKRMNRDERFARFIRGIACSAFDSYQTNSAECSDNQKKSSHDKSSDSY